MNAPIVHFYDLMPPVVDMHQEVVDGLSHTPRTIPPKFFYDQRGSELFEAITDTPEYYITHTELELLEKHSKEMAGLLGKSCLLVELGSGSSRKIRLLLDALQPAAYVPVDISRDFLLDSAHSLAIDYPTVEVHATCADFSHRLELPKCCNDLQRAFFFPGSSIGNFEPPQATALLSYVAQILGYGGHLLIGVDLQKDHQLLNRAYNDNEGITAAFNLNLLSRMNRELGSDFDIDRFAHKAFYNSKAGRIEMHLVSRDRQQVQIDSHQFNFLQGDSIHTENSYKYTLYSFRKIAREAGFKTVKVWSDRNSLFSIHCLRSEKRRA